jgi:predicted cupin superfamily sugar epimerase
MNPPKTALKPGSSALAVVEQLGLGPHPEGGHFAETFRSALGVASAAHSSERSASTAIYFLLATDEFSAFHRVRSDEVWHRYAGDVLELHSIDDQGRHERRLLGTDLVWGERPQIVIPAGVWQAARPMRGPSGYVLVGCTVAPGFEFADFEMPERDELVRRYPEHRRVIEELTRPS